MEFQTVVNHRRMVRTYDLQRPVPPEVIDRIVNNALRAPSAGFSQGWGFLVLDTPEDIARFREASRSAPDSADWLSSSVEAPLIIVPHSNKDVYLDRYAQPDKTASSDQASSQLLANRSDTWWPAPYWDIDTGFASLMMLLTAVDAGLGACFFGMPKAAIDAFRKEFNVPAHFQPIGAISIGYSEEPVRDLRGRRKPTSEVVHRGGWGQPWNGPDPD
jgi:nitroreductase